MSNIKYNSFFAAVLMICFLSGCSPFKIYLDDLRDPAPFKNSAGVDDWQGPYGPCYPVKSGRTPFCDSDGVVLIPIEK